MQSHRFVTEVWSTDNPKLQIISVSWRSVAEQVRQDAGYSAFVAELHRRLARSDSVAQFSTGLPAVTYWIGVVTFVGVSIAMAVLTVRAARRGEWGTAAVIGAFAAMFIWQIGLYFRRNRPGRYRPDALPQDLLPRA
jgi:hypothetical protein